MIVLVHDTYSFQCSLTRFRLTSLLALHFMRSGKLRLRFRGGQLAHENNEYLTPRKLHAIRYRQRIVTCQSLQRLVGFVLHVIIEERDWKCMRGLSTIPAHPCFAYAHTMLQRQLKQSFFRRTEKCLGLRDIAQGYASQYYALSTQYSCNLNLEVSTKGVS